MTRQRRRGGRGGRGGKEEEEEEFIWNRRRRSRLFRIVHARSAKVPSHKAVFTETSHINDP